MKNISIISFLMIALSATWFSAQNKINSRFDTKALKLGMTVEQLKDVYGSPIAQSHNQLTYIFENDSELIVTIREDIVSSAKLKFRRPIKIKDSKMRTLSLVQMQSEENFFGRPSWFFAGKPESGLIYKITADGKVESLTWVPPFTYSQGQPKQLQALVQDFQVQQTVNL